MIVNDVKERLKNGLGVIFLIRDNVYLDCLLIMFVMVLVGGLNWILLYVYFLSLNNLIVWFIWVIIGFRCKDRGISLEVFFFFIWLKL